VGDKVSSIGEFIAFERILEIERPQEFVEVKVGSLWLFQSFVESINLKMANAFLNGNLI
jgi:hypothetical protein